MARYTGPKAKIGRRFGDPILGAYKAVKKKPYPAGHHGKVRKKKSEYGQQLQEKQKAKYTYGLLERQFYNLFQKSAHKTGITGVILLQMLETRLDNTIYRLGIAPTRRAARQLVTHGHIEVDGLRVNIPSFALKPGNIVGIRQKSKNIPLIQDSLNGPSNNHPWLEWDKNKMVGKLMDYPQREDIPEQINEQSIVELYSK